ncbi:hypothetical protein NCCP1664_04750 [Zafaria cholistanensis]|uniref:Uncharacterized protein n=1 Tax=Zafaria cholistanensis TaxID=1682741 RepID=A0A5A7NQ85_9MICC|nr:hypothetical protein [Zafaria cholistanensis]GER21978.1 hypothetical protein NCCP1664_04750 [Zafaria cholistanensis]
MAFSRQRPVPGLPLRRRDALRLLAAAPLLAADSPATLAALRARSPGAAGGPPGAHPVVDGGPTIPTAMAGWGSSTMAAMAAELESLAAGHGWAYLDGGAGGQTAEQILARLGSRPARMDAGLVPSRGAVLLTTGSMSARAPAAFDAWGTLAGIPGRLAKDPGRQPGYLFLRTLPGPAREVPDGTPFIPATETAARIGIGHLNIGKNNLTRGHPGTHDPARIVEWTGEAHDWLASSGTRVLVWGHFPNTGTPRSSPVRKGILQVNEELQARYGSRYLDLHGLVAGDEIWELAGVHPTAEDRREQKLGNKPPGLSHDRAHLSRAGRRAVRIAVEHRLAELGWFRAAQPPLRATALPRWPSPRWPSPRQPS